MRHTDQHMRKQSTTHARTEVTSGPKIMSGRSGRAPLCGADGRQAGGPLCARSEAATHPSGTRVQDDASPAETAPPVIICWGPALHGRSRRGSGRSGASGAGSWGGGWWATRPSVALCSSLACCQLPREARQKLSGGRSEGGKVSLHVIPVGCGRPRVD